MENGLKGRRKEEERRKKKEERIKEKKERLCNGQKTELSQVHNKHIFN